MKPIKLRIAGPAQPAFPHPIERAPGTESDRCRTCESLIMLTNTGEWQHVRDVGRTQSELLALEFGVHGAEVQGDDLAGGDDRGEDRCPNCDHTRYDHVTYPVSSENVFGWGCQREPRGVGDDAAGRTNEDMRRSTE